MNELTIKIVTKDEFTEILLAHLINDKMCWSKEDIIHDMLNNGFPKLDFDRLNECLSKMFVYLPSLAVDFGNTQFVWGVSGSDAVLVDKNNCYKK